jgi:hypothetical protein
MRGRLAGQREAEHRAYADLTFHPQASAVSFHDFPGNGEAEAGAALARRAEDAGLAEGLKQFSDLACGLYVVRPRKESHENRAEPSMALPALDTGARITVRANRGWR